MWLLGGILAGLAGAAGTAWRLLRSPVPAWQGSVDLPGLETEVQVTFDAGDIPHVWAASETDAQAALGYLHVRERAWQMELQRRTAAGRLSELFGRRTLDTDRFLRRLGLVRVAAAEWEQTPPGVRSLLEAYCRGVNAGLTAVRARPPVEFRLLRAPAPAPWTPVECLAQARLLAFGLSMGWAGQLWRARLAARLGPELTARLEGGYRSDWPYVTPAAAAPALDELADLLHGALEWIGPGASNGWAVAPGRSASGGALLSNDMHLPLTVPSIFYLAHLSAPGLDAAGITRPGLPGVLAGRNRHVAWGFTVAPAVTTDLYVHRLHPADPGRYLFEGEWVTANQIPEEIAVRGQSPVMEQVRVTRQGPLLTGGGLAMALRWGGLDPCGGMAPAILACGRAAGAEELRLAMAGVRSPCLHALMADSGGRIAYQLTGGVPRRRRGSGLTPAPGWAAEWEWDGFIPAAELPGQTDPAAGYVATANNPAGGSAHIAWELSSQAGYRARRIARLLEANPAVTLEDCMAMQQDTDCAPLQEFARHLLRIRPGAPLERRALGVLAGWDGRAAADSPAYAVCQAALLATLDLTFAGVLAHRLNLAPDPTWAGMLPMPSPLSLLPCLLRELEQRDPDFPAAVGAHLPAGGGDPWQRLLAAGLTAGVKGLERAMGPRVEEWRWDRVHRLRAAHPMGRGRLSGRLFNAPPAGLAGDHHSLLVNANRPDATGNTLAVAFRQLVDMSDPSRLWVMHLPGQSGHPGSRHYRDLVRPWLAGQNRVIDLDRAAAEQSAVARVVLRPSPAGTTDIAGPLR